MRMLCNTPSRWLGAEPCCREWKHPGECFWWVKWQAGGGRHTYWKGVVYRDDDSAGRVKVARGDFDSEPNGIDLLRLCQLLTRKKLEERARAEHARANPQPILPAIEDVAAVPAPTESAAGRAARAMAAEVRRGAL